MDLNLSDEQQQLVDSFGALYAKDSPPERVRAAETAEPTGHDPELWLRLLENGAVEMAVDERAGGWGASLLDLALVAEQHGRYLAAAPLIEAQVAARLLGRLLGRLGPHSPAARLLEPTLNGGRLVTLALRRPAGGVLGLVPAGAVADDVIFFDGSALRHLALDELDDVDDVHESDESDESDEPAGERARRPVTTIGSLPVADIALAASSTPELASGAEAATAFEEAVNEWMILMAGALVGIGARSLEIGVEYVKERKAFGVPIGSFQAVSHGLADAATALDGGTLLAREAAWSAEVEPARTPELGPLAFGFCAEAAREASYRSLHYHGGYGFMLEYDIQLYFRRARGWPGQFAEPDVAFGMAAARRLSARRAAASDGEA